MSPIIHTSATKANTPRGWESCTTLAQLFSAGLAVFIFLFSAGCSSSHTRIHSDSVEESFTVPPFLAGPVAIALTNANSFSGRMVVDLAAYTPKSKTITGHLLVSGTHLMFAPTDGDRTFIWDAAKNDGYVLSEALQGYAPISSHVQITNAMERTNTAEPVLASVNGRTCRRTETAVSFDDGGTAKVIVWREVGANGCPARIELQGGTTPLTINIFDLRRETFPQKLFEPPDGFTKYANAQTLREELLMRQEAARKKPRRGDENGVQGIGHLEGPSQISR